MKKLITSWNFTKHFIFSLLITVFFSLLLPLLFKVIIGLPSKTTDSSIGIIGGADGPTAIFLTTSNNYFSLWSIVLFVIMLILYKPIKMLIEKTFKS